MAEHLLEAVDPCAIIRQMGYTWYGWQADLLSSQSDRIYVLAYRGARKSFTAAVRAAYRLRYGGLREPFILILSENQDKAAETWRYCRKAIQAMVSPPVYLRSPGMYSAEFKGGGRVMCLPSQDEDQVRSYHGVTDLIYDEAACISDAVHAAARPTLREDGTEIILTTAKRRGVGWAYTEWVDLSYQLERICVPIDAVPEARTNKQYCEDVQRRPKWWIDREYNCIWTDDDDQAIGASMIHAAVDHSIASLELVFDG